MRIVKAYQGKYIAYRAWFNGKLIWSYGDDTMGDLVAALNAVAKPEPEVPDAILLQGEANTRGAGLAEVWELDPVLTQTGAGISSNATPRAAETVHPMAAGVIQGRATARPYTYGTVFTRGHAPAELSTQAKPNTAEAVRAVGVADFGSIDVASRPRPEEVPRILAAADATIDAPAVPVPQEPEGVVMKTSNGLTSNAGVGTLPVHTVTFMVDGEIKHQEKVIHGYACPDPVATGKIAAPTKEMTVSHTYEHSGWEGETEEGTEILAEQTIEGFVYDSSMGAYAEGHAATFELVAGQTYNVSWDGKVHTCTAYEFTANGYSGIGVGNEGVLTGVSTEVVEPFAIMYVTSSGYNTFISLDGSTAASHTVAIYQSEVGVTSDPLSCVTQDIVVYPTFTESIRYYTVRFWDGDTLVDTVTVPYGGTAVTSYTKPGYKATWEPSNENITGDTDCYGRFDEVTFANSTWAEIAEISEAGNAASYFALGDTKTFTCNGKTYTAEIVGLNLDPLSDSTGKAGISCVITGYYSSTYKYHSSVVSWDSSNLRTYCNGTIYNGIQDDLKAVIKQVVKYSAYKYSSVSTNDYCWVPSAKEAGGSGSYEGSAVKYTPFDQTKRDINVNWHLRTVNSNLYHNYVDTSGNIKYETTLGAKYIRFGFCI